MIKHSILYNNSQFAPAPLVFTLNVNLQYVANTGQVLYLKTNLKADRYKLISLNLDSPSQV